MTKEEIVRRRLELDRDLRVLDAQKVRVQAEINILQAECDHPEKYTYTAQGDPGVHCPDCGWTT